MSTKEQVVKLYVEEHITADIIARRLGMTEAQVNFYLDEWMQQDGVEVPEGLVIPDDNDTE